MQATTLSTFQEVKDGIIGFLLASVLGLAALVRRLDISEINRRQAETDARVSKLEARLVETEKELAELKGSKEFDSRTRTGEEKSW